MPTSLRIARTIDRWTRRVGRAVAWLLLVMVLVGAYHAVARSLMPHVGVRLTSNALLELQWYLFGAAFLLGAPHALRLGDHVRVDVLYGRLSRRARLWIDVVGGALFLIPFCAVAVLLSVDFVVDSWLEGEWSNDPAGLPRWPIKPLVPLAFALLLLQATAELLKRVAVLRGADPVEAGLRGEEGHDA